MLVVCSTDCGRWQPNEGLTDGRGEGISRGPSVLTLGEGATLGSGLLLCCRAAVQLDQTGWVRTQLSFSASIVPRQAGALWPLVTGSCFV